MENPWGWSRLLTLGALVVGLTGLTSGSAEAAPPAPELLRPSTRPFYALVGVGAAAGIGGTCYDGYYYGGRIFNEEGYLRFGCGSAIKFSQEVGFHLTGGGSGPAVALLVQQEVLGNAYRGLTVAPKVLWDIQVIRGIGFYVAPNLALGAHTNRWRGHPAAVGGDLQGGITLRLVLGDRGQIFTQLPHFDLVFGPGYSRVRYEFLVGGGITF